MTKAMRLFRLSSRERTVLLQALPMLPLARVSLALLGFNRTQRLMRRVSPIRAQASNGRHFHDDALMTMRMVRAAAVHGACHATCLPRSLVTWALLRRRGFDPDLQIGARKKHGVLEAHAWVAIGSLTFGEDVSDDGVPFAPFASRTTRDEPDHAVC